MNPSRVFFQFTKVVKGTKDDERVAVLGSGAREVESIEKNSVTWTASSSLDLGYLGTYPVPKVRDRVVSKAGRGRGDRKQNHKLARGSCIINTPYTIAT